MSCEKPSLKSVSNALFNKSISDEGKSSPSFSKTVLLAMNLMKSPWLLSRCRRTSDHMQAIQKLIRDIDKLKVIVKLDKSLITKRDKYLLLLSELLNGQFEQYLIVGVDVTDNNDDVTVGLVLPVTKDTDICLDGEGGFYISCGETVHSFQPISVQEMWTALQALVKAVCSVRNKQVTRPIPDDSLDEWVAYYRGSSQSSTQQVIEWMRLDDDLSSSSCVRERLAGSCHDNSVIKTTIRRKLQEILVNADLDNVTSKQVRDKLEEMLKMDLVKSLKMTTNQYRQYVDEEMIMVMRQMDNPSQILDFLFLGSEWNASNLEELQRNGVGYILNVTKEIDNFFPGMFKYCNVRVYDYEETELIKHWNSTFKFIDEARRTASKILVHCKMGVSRSASTSVLGPFFHKKAGWTYPSEPFHQQVIAYLMKGHQCTLEHAYQLVKQKRTCVQPNPGFMQQLIIYQGILDASNHRHNRIFRSKSINGVDSVDNEIIINTQRSKSQMHGKHKCANNQVGDRADQPTPSPSSSSHTSVKLDDNIVKKSISVPVETTSLSQITTSSSSPHPPPPPPPLLINKLTTSATTSSSSSSSSPPPTPSSHNETFVVSEVDINCLNVASTALTPSSDVTQRDDVIIIDDESSLSKSSVLRQWSCMSPGMSYDDVDGGGRREDGGEYDGKSSKTTKERSINEEEEGDDDSPLSSQPLCKMRRSLSWPSFPDDSYALTMDEVLLRNNNSMATNDQSSKVTTDGDGEDDGGDDRDMTSSMALTSVEENVIQVLYRCKSTKMGRSGRKVGLRKFNSVLVE